MVQGMTKNDVGAVDAETIKRGVPPKMSDGQRKQVFLDDASLEEAKRLGKGEVSAGIRLALRHTAQAGLKPSYRAAYWTAGQSNVCLTTEEDSALPDNELLVKPAFEAFKRALAMEEGKIVISAWKA